MTFTGKFQVRDNAGGGHGAACRGRPASESPAPASERPGRPERPPAGLRLRPSAPAGPDSGPTRRGPDQTPGDSEPRFARVIIFIRDLPVPLRLRARAESAADSRFCISSLAKSGIEPPRLAARPPSPSLTFEYAGHLARWLTGRLRLPGPPSRPRRRRARTARVGAPRPSPGPAALMALAA